MSKNFLDDIAQALEMPKRHPNYLAQIGMFGRPTTSVANALLSLGEQTSDRIASIASRGLKAPESLTLDEIQAVCASALTQAPNHI